MSIINAIAIILTLAFFVMTIVGLIKPSLLKDKKSGKIPDRKMIAIGGIGAFIICFIIAGVTGEDIKKESPKEENTITNITEPSQDSSQSTNDKYSSNFNMTPEEFRIALNKEIEEKDISSIQLLKKFNMKKAGDGEIAQYELANGKIILNATTDSSGKIKEVFYIMAGMESNDEIINAMALPILTANVLNKTANQEESNKAIMDLVSKAADGINKENNTHEIFVGNVKYYSLASPHIGFWIGFQPKK